MEIFQSRMSGSGSGLSCDIGSGFGQYQIGSETLLFLILYVTITLLQKLTLKIKLMNEYLIFAQLVSSWHQAAALAQQAEGQIF